MDLSKSYEYFQPEKLTDRVHIIGCGSVGSTVAENLARSGVTKFTLWDFDVVEPHNLANQMFRISRMKPSFRRKAGLGNSLTGSYFFV